ncbi:MAG TPA: hypothetical protein VGD59_00060 [Acidisarcina sp.]
MRREFKLRPQACTVRRKAQSTSAAEAKGTKQRKTKQRESERIQDRGKKGALRWKRYKTNPAKSSKPESSKPESSGRKEAGAPFMRSSTAHEWERTKPNQKPKPKKKLLSRRRLQLLKLRN